MNEAAPQPVLLADKLMALLSGKITLDGLRAAFPVWHVFGRDGRWWAFRAGAATEEGPRSLIQPLLCAVTPGGLAEQLALQEWLRAMPGAELDAVWLAAVTG